MSISHIDDYILTDLSIFVTSLGTGVILALDHGDKNIGCAICDEERSMALPLCLIQNNTLSFKYINDIVLSKNVVGIVVGYPLNMDGSVGMQADKVMKFASALGRYLNKQIFLQDERCTSLAAVNLLKASGVSAIKNYDDNKIAASLILDTVLTLIKNL